MAWHHFYNENINLHGSGRISRKDAERQRRTATHILRQFTVAPGQVLADEVGMGKTFVALAVAASVTLQDDRPVVIMTPSAVLEKWQRDFSVFAKTCLPRDLQVQLNMGVADNGVEFLKLLDDPPERRKQIIFLAHGALSRKLSDIWVKLAIIKRAMKHRHAKAERRSVARFAGKLVRQDAYTRRYPGLWQKLLEQPTSNWKKILHQEMGDTDEQYIVDDPVPEGIVQALDHPDVKPLLDELWAEIQCIPMRIRNKDNFEKRLKDVRVGIQAILPRLWQLCFQRANIQLPLLVLDEAHHLKNAATHLASMFHSPESEADADVVSKGQLAGVFERMLFLTATPFQLGHHELCSILERFNGIAWDSQAAPEWDREMYRQKLVDLNAVLDASQGQALDLERKWGRLREDDMVVEGKRYDVKCVDAWWGAVTRNDVTDENLKALQRTITDTIMELDQANRALKQFVVRHSRPQVLSDKHADIPRRRKLSGRSVVDHDDSHDDHDGEGLRIDSASALPFLLAARYIALTPGQRPVTAEGLASSYEAFLDTRQNLLDGNVSQVIEEDVVVATNDVDDTQNWYLQNIIEAIKPEGRVLSEQHPKIGPVVDKVIELWGQGEKVLVFCHYVKTGRALRTHISYLMRKKLYEQAANKLSCNMDEVEYQLEKNAKRFRKGSGLYRRMEEIVGAIISRYKNLESDRDCLLKIVHHFMITPTFLVRYFEFAGSTVQPESLHLAFEYREKSGLSFSELLRHFCKFLNELTSDERGDYLQALDSIQTGDITLKSDVNDKDEKDAILASVRLINGSVKQDTRQNLMLAFNTPFYPEILIASSVMAEGVDLHLNCRHLIHYDLSWNPSDLEQRTGRVDRLGAKAEKAGQPIHIYYPYLEGTQDEKMYRVVMDRDRWFNVVMGGTFEVDYQTTEKLSERIPLPSQVLQQLKMDLECTGAMDG